MGKRYSDFNKSVGSSLQRLRKKAGFKSAKVFAEKLGMNPSTYTDYEQGKAMFSYERAWEMADALNCTMDELGGREWPRPAFQDERQELMNESFEALNDDSKSEVAGMVASIASDPARRIEKKGGKVQNRPVSEDCSEEVA